MATTNARVSTVFEEHEVWMKHNLQPSTRKGYRRPLRILRQVLDEAGVERIAHVEEKHLFMAFERLAATTPRGEYMAGTQNQHASAYRSLFRYCTEHKPPHVGKSRNPAANLKHKSEPPRKMIVVPPQRWAELIQHGFSVHPRDGVILSTFLHLGLRLGELSSIRIGDLDEDLCRISWKRSKVRDRKPMAIADVLKAHLEGWLDWLRARHGELDPSWYLFPARIRLGRSIKMNPDWPVNPTGQICRQTVTDVVKNSMLALGYSKSQLEQQACHVTRRSAGVAFQRQHKDMRKTGRFLGQRRLATTELYLMHGDDEEEFDADVRELGTLVTPSLDDISPAPKPVSIDVDLDNPEEILRLIDTPTLLFEVVQRLTPMELITFMAKVTRHIDPERVRWMLELAQGDIRPYKPLALAA